MCGRTLSKGASLDSASTASTCGAKNSANNGWRAIRGATTRLGAEAGATKRASMGEWSDVMARGVMGMVRAA